MSERLCILVVEDNPADADLIHELLRENGPVRFQIESVARLAAALTRLKREDIDLVLLDLGLPDSQGLATFHQLRQALPNLPVIVLTGTDDQELAVAAVRAGAQDFLVKGQFSGQLLIRTARYAQERQKTMHELRVHQSQLKMQNEELRRAQVELDTSRTRYFDLYDLAPVGYFTVSEAGLILEANLTSTTLLGVARSALVKQPLRRFIFEEDADSYYLLRKQLMETGEPQTCELRMVKSDAPPFWATMAATAVPDENGAPVCRIVLSDISVRKRLEQDRAVLDAQVRQQQKLEAIGTLAAGVAHEINNPISGAMNYAQLVLDDAVPGSRTAEFAREIIHETERVAAIVRNLLRFSHPGTETSSSARLEDIVESTMSLIRTITRHDQITLSVNLPADLPNLICRSQQLQQVIMNLMTNARDALNERYPRYDPDKVLRLSAHQFQKEGRCWIRLTVEDHGVGITPEVCARMFDPFFTTKPRDKGTGLGLAISHGIVKEHQGELTVESEPGRFTRMYMDLPVGNG